MSPQSNHFGTLERSEVRSQLDLDSVRVDPSWSMRIPATFAFRQKVLPLCKFQQSVVVACEGRVTDSVAKALKSFLQSEIDYQFVDPKSLHRGLQRVYGTLTQPRASFENLANKERGGKTGADGVDPIAVCDEILHAALLHGASDIHMLPNETSLQIQFRVDGCMEPFRNIAKTMQGGVLSRLKVMAGLDIAEKRSPQDGRFSIEVGTRTKRIDIRVATLPTRHGERITLRLLTPQGSKLSLSTLGMSEQDLKAFQRGVARPHGLVLLTGPTGSGKSTTLYAAIEQLVRFQRGNIITVEDPMEHEIEGVSQVEVDSADKVNFPKALRSILRHDPDVIMIGEIRDAETANIAVKASLTGHLVLSTLHTNTASGVVTRLVDMGVERFLVAATLRLAVAQRLVRKLCTHCRNPRPLALSEAIALNRPELAEATVFESQGCVYCAGRGYSGRIALFEMMESNERMAQRIAQGATEEQICSEQFNLEDKSIESMNETQIDHASQNANPSSLVNDGVRKLLDGTTSFAEVLNAVAVW